MWFVELIKAVAWPVTVVIIAFVCKPELHAFGLSFLRRKFELELPGGFKAKIDVAEQQRGENPTTEKLDAKPTPTPSQRVAINRIETQLRAELTNIDTDKREPVLLSALALSRLERAHEFIYNRIFGSQIAALKRLNEVGRATVEDARAIFTPYAERFPEMYRTYGFDQWLGFVIGNGLVVRNGDVLEISDYGRDFLLYLTDKRLLENKFW